MAVMTESALPRPRQVTMAGWMVVVGSVLAVVSVFERMAGLNSLEVRESVEEFLRQSPGTGLDVEGTLSVLRGVTMVAGGCAAATAVLGVHVLRRSRGARLGVTVLAIPLFVTGLVAGGFLTSVVAFAAILLWLPPSRDWFDGRPPPRRADREPASARTDAAPPAPPPPTASEPRAHPGFGAMPGPTGPPPGTWATQPPPPPRGARPDVVLWACLITWIFAGLVSLLMVMSAAVVATAPELVLDQLRRQDPEVTDDVLTQGTLTSALYGVAAVSVVWSVVASVLAVLVLRRVRWARVALMASTGGVVAFLLVGVAQGQLLLLLPVMAAVTTLLLLARPEVRRWINAP